jgi:diguanylate cyclase (GGDEF)-like protein
MLHELLKNAQLTPEQRSALQNLENELAEAREQVKTLKARVVMLEEQTAGDHTILTRPEFNREVARMLAFDERYGGTSSVLYFDFAGLGGLAARYGDIVSTETIGTIANLMMRYVRRSDIIGRLGADEFGVLLVRCDNENAWKKGRSLAALLAPALEIIGGRNLGLEISFGAYTFRDEEDVASGLKQAAGALTKMEGK